jgi:putative iron-regulated protein
MNLKLPILAAIFFVIASTSCKKDEDDTTTTTEVTPAEVLNDFAFTLAIPNYTDLHAKASTLNQASILLKDSTTNANLQSARDAWRAVRQSWEQAEGYLIGPVSDYNYDPATDSWPVNTAELDSLLASNNPLEVENVDSLQFTLKGYHAIEYVIFGVGGTRTAAELSGNPRLLKYLTSLTQSLTNTLAELIQSWDVNVPGNFATQLINAGNGSLRFATRKDAFLEIVNAMTHICDEVANAKMEAPLAVPDSELVESQYAHNATTDFRNNIIGVQNVYMCKYFNTGKSLHDLVKAKNLSLDNDIQAKINASLNALAGIDPNYGHAIYTQQSQILIAQNAINELLNAMNLLTNFVHSNINE